MPTRNAMFFLNSDVEILLSWSNTVFSVKWKCDAQHHLFIMLWRGVVIDLACFNSLPSRPWWWFHNWCHSDSKQRSCFSKINKIEQNPLIDMDIFNGKVEPESCAGIARVGTNKQIIFILVDEINASQIPYQTIVKIIVWYTNKVL